MGWFVAPPTNWEIEMCGGTPLTPTFSPSREGEDYIFSPKKEKFPDDLTFGNFSRFLRYKTCVLTLASN